jgi:hypothetical protein
LRHSRNRLRRLDPAGRRRCASAIASILTIGLALGVLTPEARANSREDRLLSITKTTVYGALLGGILGFASALVVRDGYEDDAVRWGIVVGAFGGCAYGIATPDDEDDWDDFSDRLRSYRSERNLAPPSDLASLQTFPGLSRIQLRLIPNIPEESNRKTSEVRDGGFEEEVCGEEEER